MCECANEECAHLHMSKFAHLQMSYSFFLQRSFPFSS
jgi:hypothetical protein